MLIVYKIENTFVFYITYYAQRIAVNTIKSFVLFFNIVFFFKIKLNAKQLFGGSIIRK